MYLSSGKNVATMQAKGTKGSGVYNPYVLTEEGICVLMAVLKWALVVK